MLISDLEYLEFAEGEKAIDGGERVQAFSGAAAAVATLLIDPPPGISSYSRASASSSSMVIGDYASTNSTSRADFGIIADRDFMNLYIDTYR